MALVRSDIKMVAEGAAPDYDNAQQKRLFDLAASLEVEVGTVHVISILAELSDYVRNLAQDNEAPRGEPDRSGAETHRRLQREFRKLLSDLRKRARRMTLDELANEVRCFIRSFAMRQAIASH